MTAEITAAVDDATDYAESQPDPTVDDAPCVYVVRRGHRPGTF